MAILLLMNQKDILGGNATSQAPPTNMADMIACSRFPCLYINRMSEATFLSCRHLYIQYIIRRATSLNHLSLPTSNKTSSEDI